MDILATIGSHLSESSEAYRQSLKEFLISTCGIQTPSDELIDTVVIAFTTPDYAKEMGDKAISIENSDRLEFYGDSVVKHIVCRELYEKHPSMSKGDMTFIAEHLWSNKSYPECMYAAGIRVIHLLRISKGILGQYVLARSEALFSKIGNSFEALVGALDLCGYYGEAVDLVRRTVDSEMEWAVGYLKDNHLKAESRTFNLRGKELKEAFIQRYLSGDY